MKKSLKSLSTKILKQICVFENLLVLFILLETAPAIYGQASKIENKLETIIKEEGIPGIQVTHMKNDTIKTYHVGAKKYGLNKKIKANTLFQAASMSKSAMAYIALRLHDKDIIDLDAPLRKYWKYPRLDKNSNHKNITARMALNHTTGFPNWTKPPGDTLKPAFKPGTNFKYSGEGYLYLQKVMEHLTKKTLEDIAIEELFEPLGMEQSHFIYKSKIADNYAYGHDKQKPKSLRKIKSPNGAYSLITTTEDYTTFIKKALIKGQGLKPNTHKMMIGYSSSRKPRTGYGLGVQMQRTKKGKAIFHKGSNPGFRTFYFAYPESNESVVCFTNGSNGENIRTVIAQVFLGKDNFWAFE